MNNGIEIFQDPVQHIRTVDILGGSIGIYAYAVDAREDRRLVFFAFAGFKSHVMAAWAHLMSGESISFYGKGYVTIQRDAAKGAYSYYDINLESGDVLRCLYSKRCTSAGSNLVEQGDVAYYVAEYGRGGRDKRFGLRLQQEVLIPLDDAWLDKMYDVGYIPRRPLVYSPMSEGIEIVAFRKSDDAWRKALAAGLRNGKLLIG